MQERHNRKKLIAKIVNSNRIHTQDELLQVLNEEGIFLTQATLSRDMKQLGAFKYSGENGESYYKIPAAKAAAPHIGAMTTIACSGQICVVHCQPGFASAISTVIDNSSINGVMGSIAGDDTILVILEEAADKELIKNAINNLL